ncbi:zonadhesin-like [Branchiostoma floridae x Branchiostoma belcheri]
MGVHACLSLLVIYAVMFLPLGVQGQGCPIDPEIGLGDSPCPANSAYTTGTTCCPATCQDLSAPNSCTTGVTDGCQCDGTRVWSKNNCVEQSQCGCTDPDTGTYYELNEVWTTPGMQECECNLGNIIECIDVTCDEDGGYTWTLVDGVWACRCTGDCCDRKICKASGDPHILSPDKGRHDYQGCGLYTFAKDCTGNTFNVETKHVPLDGNPAVSAIRAVYVTVTSSGNTFIICLLQDKVVLVDGVRYALPLSLANGDIEIHLTGRFVRLELVDLCVVVYYDGLHYVKMEIPSNYENDLCGLCGNFNDNATDDMMLPDGSQAANVNQFGNSWQTQPRVEYGTWDLTCGDLPTGEPPTSGPCDPMYTDACDVLMDGTGPFADCHAAVDPTPYYEDCVSDACAKENYLCPNLETYYDCCMEAGVSPFAWRSDDLCPMDCPANSTYSSCMSACPATCVNPDAPDHCDRPCVEGCECADGYILSDLDCVVDNSGCGCTDIYDNYHPLGEQWGTEDGQQCECVLFVTFLFAQCEPVTCQEADGYYWTLVDGVYGCHCVVPCCGET